MILDRLFQLGAPGPSDDYWYNPVGSQSLAGVNVDETSALDYSAVWAATRIIAETAASLPLIEYERIATGGKQRAEDHYLYPVLHDAPNDDMDAFSFWESRVAHVVNWGNGFAEKLRDGAGRVRQLVPIHPSRLPEQNIKRINGRVVYHVRNDTGTTTPIQREDMFHIVGALSDDGLYGKGVIRQARESIGMGMATERFGATFFGNNARPGGVLEHPGKLGEAAAKTLRESWDAVHGGPARAHKTGVLEEGMKYHTIDVPPEDAQFLQTRQFNITEIARWYRLPPHVLADLSRATFSNIESETLSFIVHSIRPWLVRIERACNRQLLMEAERSRYFVEFLLDAILRGDTLTRAQASQIEFMNGEINLDEWRARENRNPLPDGLGQKHFVPQNVQTLENAVASKPPEPEQKPDMPDDDEPEEPTEIDDEPDEPEQNAVGELFDRLAAESRATAALEARLSGARIEAVAAVAAVVRRMLHKESAAAERAAGKPGEFLGWRDEFYVRHRDTLAEALGPALSTVRALGVTAEAGAIVAAHVERSMGDLLLACECQPNELPGRVASCVSAWGARADELATSLLGG